MDYTVLKFNESYIDNHWFKSHQYFISLATYRNNNLAHLSCAGSFCSMKEVPTGYLADRNLSQSIARHNIFVLSILFYPCNLYSFTSNGYTKLTLLAVIGAMKFAIFLS